MDTTATANPTVASLEAHLARKVGSIAAARGVTLPPPAAEPESYDRAEAIAAIKAALRQRSNRTWSVKGGRGTSWGWLTVIAPPKRCDQYGQMSADDCAELARLFGLDAVHGQGVSIPADSTYRTEYVQRARGLTPTVVGRPYWD